MKIEWVTGKFEEFIADVAIKIGSSDPAVSIPVGSSFLFDGTTITFSGASYSGRGLRGAYEFNWYHKADSRPVSSPKSYRGARDVALSKAGALDLSQGPPKIIRHGSLAVHADEVDTVMRVDDRKSERTSSNQSVELGSKIDSRTPQVVTSATRARKFPIRHENADHEEDHGESMESRGGGNPGNATTDLRVVLDAIQSLNSRINDISTRVDSMKRESESGPQKGIDQSEPDIFDSPEEDMTDEIDPKVSKAISLMPTFPRDFSFSGKLKDRVDRVSAVYKSLPKSKKAEFISVIYLLEDQTARKALSKLFPV